MLDKHSPPRAWGGRAWPTSQPATRIERPSVADLARGNADRAADSPVDAGAGSSSGMHRQHEDQGQRVGL
jgi:hypothetical protein